MTKKPCGVTNLLTLKGGIITVIYGIQPFTTRSKKVVKRKTNSDAKNAKRPQNAERSYDHKKKNSYLYFYQLCLTTAVREKAILDLRHKI